MTDSKARVRRVTPADRIPAAGTAGMRREVAVTLPGLWSGTAHTEPGAVSGWHHHGEYETVAYVASGQFKVESGPGGTASFIAEVGDFVHIPAQEIHRESNPSTEPAQVLLFRAGHGEVVVNVDGPEPAG